MGLKHVVICWIVATVLIACQDPRPEGTLETDLGPAGNRAVTQAFLSYKNKMRHCTGKSTDPTEHRILMSGFGPFKGTEVNISGVVVQSLANPLFWPDVYRDDDAIPSGLKPASGRVSPQSFGGETSERHLVLQNKKYHVCFLSLDVKWDLAAAIILHEIQLFQPQAVILSGLGGDYHSATFEGGAVNQATGLPGFNGDGSADQNNRPIASYILPAVDGKPLGSVLMTWNAPALAKVAKPFTQRIDEGYAVHGLTAGRSSNDYICNNVSYVTMQALSGRSILLAGSTMSMSLPAQTIPAGFFHYPLGPSKDATSIYRWGMMWAAVFSYLL